MWPWVCFRKIQRAFNLPRGVDWVLKGPPEGTDSPGYPRWLFHRLSFFLNSAIVEWDWTIICLFNLPLGSRLSFCLFVQSSPREKRGESYPREFTRLSQLNPNQLWREGTRDQCKWYFHDGLSQGNNFLRFFSFSPIFFFSDSTPKKCFIFYLRCFGGVWRRHLHLIPAYGRMGGYLYNL